MAILSTIKSAIGTTMKDVFKRGVKPLAQSISNVVKTATTTPKNVQSNVVPFAPAAAASTTVARGAFSGTKSLISKGYNLAKSELMGTPATIGQKLKGALIGAGSATAFLAAGKYAATGRVEAPSARSFVELVGLRASPVATIFGNIEGIGETSGDKIRNIIKNYGTTPDEKQMSSYLNPTLDERFAAWTDLAKDNSAQLAAEIRDWREMLKSNSQNPVNVSSPITINSSMPTGGGYSFSPSISTGGGTDMLTLLALLGGGGALAGYLYGRRKKKKYKKRKKR